MGDEKRTHSLGRATDARARAPARKLPHHHELLVVGADVSKGIPGQVRKRVRRTTLEASVSCDGRRRTV